jgi:hypothetical protein
MANNEENLLQEEWFTLDDIQPVECQQELYCIAVDSPAKQFLAGRLGIPTHNTEEGKAEDELKGEATMIIGSIARLGRAAGVHLIVATQRPDAAILPGEVKANLGVRINCGRTDTNASSMILGTSDGVRVKANPRGRLFVRIYGNGDHGQGFFAQPSWIDEYLAKHGQNPDGSPIAQPRSKLANITDFDELSEGGLDAHSGVDNESAIQKIRDEERQREISLGNADEEEEADGEEADEFEFEDVEDEDESTPESDKADEAPSDRPDLSTGGVDPAKFHRPEEDWDSDLDELIQENFE